MELGDDAEIVRYHEDQNVEFDVGVVSRRDSPRRLLGKPGLLLEE
jgi:hypothetical protein